MILRQPLTQNAATDRRADLHYAYQFGEDAATGDFAAVKAEFDAKFYGNADAVVQFNKGVSDKRAKLAKNN